jgi:hypothetical protein
MSFSQDANANRDDFRAFARDFIFDLNGARTKASQVTFILDGLNEDLYGAAVAGYYSEPSERPTGMSETVPYSSVKYQRDPRVNLLHTVYESDLTSAFKDLPALLQTLALQNIELRGYRRQYSSGRGPTALYSLELKLSVYEARLDMAVEVAKGRRRSGSLLSLLPKDVVGDGIMPHAGNAIHPNRLFYSTDNYSAFYFAVHLLLNGEVTQIDRECMKQDKACMYQFDKRLIFSLQNQAVLDDSLEMFKIKMREIEKMMGEWRTHTDKRFELTIASPEEIIPNDPFTSTPWSNILQHASPDAVDLFSSSTSVSGDLTVTKCALKLNSDSPTSMACKSVYIAFVHGENPYIMVVLPLAFQAEFMVLEAEFRDGVRTSQLKLEFIFKMRHSFHYFVQKLVRWAEQLQGTTESPVDTPNSDSGSESDTSL